VSDPSHPNGQERKRRPGALWMFFYGRQRRGFPWLLVGVLGVLLLLGLTFALPGGPEIWRAIAPLIVVVLILAAILAAVVATFRPRRR
jgi:peptidoglycan/LPS O-acetylase OafA/YrhL